LFLGVKNCILEKTDYFRYAMLPSILDQPKVGIISPAWSPDKQRLNKGIAYLQSHGLTVITGRHCCNKAGLFAGSEDQRLQDLHTLFADSSIAAIFCSRGGWGTLKLLDKIDYQLIKRNPKALIGYSDITTLQLAIWQKTKVPSISGPMAAVDLAETITRFTEKHFWGQLENRESYYSYRLDNLRLVNDVISVRSVSGILLGGCLSLIAALVGTPFFPDCTNKILFLEEVGEKPHKIDRALAQLYQAGVFKHIRGLILGDFVDCTGSYSGRVRYTIKEIFASYFKHVSFPVIVNFPYGHKKKIFTLPIGVQATIDLAQKQLILQNPFK
jgi:muramoyltetrapeptide carboxypeptidase